jgi:hypothetical protein
MAHLLRIAFQLFKEAGLKMRLKECVFGLEKMEYLGCIVSGGKLSVSTKKAEAVNKWPVPKTRREVHIFVMSCDFYAKSTHNFTSMPAPLIYLLKTSKPVS